MRIWAGGLALEVAPGVTASDIARFVGARGVELPDQPWCGPTRLSPTHQAGRAPLVAFASLTPIPGPDARPHPGMHLAIAAGPDAGAVATLSEGLVVGRAPGATVSVADPTLSAEHVSIADGRVRDAGSRNGTRVNGRRVRKATLLTAGDALTAGRTVVCVRDDAVSTASEADAGGRRPPLASIATGGAAAASMAVFAIAAGHWQFALLALALPALALTPRLLGRLRPSPTGPLLDVTGTLGCPPVPAGPVAVSGPAGLMRAVTLATGRPAPRAPHWEDWMATLAPAHHEVTWLRDGEPPPSWAQVVIRADGERVSVAAGGVTTHGPLPLVSATAADATARRLAARTAPTAIPTSVRWAQLPPPAAGGLPVRLGMGASGPVVLDLVADGPHVLVAGTTGAGKSEALRTIIGSLAHDFPPTAVTFAIIDFKGGAGLGPCAALPHVASVLTDLEPHLARRCLLALAAELADRKRAVARAGASSYDEWRGTRPPRLVVVVDEFQEIASADRDFLPQLARLAAQGRSLGIHLLLATQRPAGAVGAEIRANISAIVALRTASDADSRDLVGTGAAAAIPPDLPGRALLQRGTAVEEVQVALPLADLPAPILEAERPEPPGRSLLEAVAAGESASSPRLPQPLRSPQPLCSPQPLWLPELPTLLGAARTQSGSFTLGVADLPGERRRESVTWDPAAGALVVVGPPRSGRSGVLKALAAQAGSLGLTAVAVPATPRLAVRTLALALERDQTLLLVDDAARLLAAAATADPEAVDLLTTALARMPVALAVPQAWATHRLTTASAIRIVMTGLAADDDAAWEVPRELRGLPPRAGRARVARRDGWVEAQLALPGGGRPLPLAIDLPAACPPVPDGALGVGGDDAAPVFLPRLPTAVVGPPGPDRDAVARRVATVTGVAPMVTESAFTLGMPGGAAAPRTIVLTRPTLRSLREVARDAPRGLVDPQPPALRVVAITDGTALAVQVSGP